MKNLKRDGMDAASRKHVINNRGIQIVNPKP
jgi:hypothetical protein